jgi:hypothetical protein
LGQAKFQLKLLAHNGHQHVNADGNPDLRLDSVVGRAEKVLDPQVLLDPLEEQFYPPAAFVELGDVSAGKSKLLVRKTKDLPVFGSL